MLSRNLLIEALLGMFELAPIAICISTTSSRSRYLRANPAYLDLVGHALEDIEGKPLTVAAVDGPDRERRQAILASEGRYRNEAAEIRHSSGRTIPVLITALRVTVGGVSVDIETIVDNSDQVRHRELLDDVAQRDFLTGLRNRSGFERRLADVLADPLRADGACLAFLDLNGFKAMNDIHGHQAGDAFLRTVAARLMAASRGSDCVARVGGDEFAIVFGTPVQDVDGMVGRIKAMAEEVFTPVDAAGVTLVGGAAIGLAFARPGDGPADLFGRADEAMYRAKRTGEPVAIRTDLHEERLAVADSGTFRRSEAPAGSNRSD